jgi:cell wall-associated NlpC family hydrolase
LNKAGLAAALTLVLAACATTRAPSENPVRPGSSIPGPSMNQGTPRDRHELMVYNAMTMLGQPYRFGGAAPGGFDCSGLVLYAANGAGLRLPRTAREQLGVGQHVARGELRAGDLVFMHLAHKELHVGIAIDAERFIHAPSTGGSVRIDTLASPTYAKGFLGARRIPLAQ